MSLWARRVQNSFSRYLASERSGINRYGLSLVLTLLGCYVVYQIQRTENVQVASIILAMTVLSAIHGGIGPALTSTVIASIFIEIWLLQSPTAWPSAVSGVLRFLTYIFVSVSVSAVLSLLRQVYVTSEDLRSKAEAVNREKDAILSVVAHDLRNPIGSAIGFAELMLDSSEHISEEDRRKFIGNIHRSCRLALDIIKDLQEFACLGNYRQHINYETVDLTRELRNIIMSMEIQARNKQIVLLSDMPETAVRVRSDVKLLNRALQNVLENAIKYSPVCSEVTVTCRPFVAVGKVEVEICDQGPGIPLEEHEKVFEPFYKTKNKPTQGETSTGLGLPSVKSIADMLGIGLRLESDGRCGTAFTLSFPMDQTKARSSATDPCRESLLV